MYLDFLYVIVDHFSILTKPEKWFEWGIPIFLGVVISLCVSSQIQYDLIKEIVDFLKGAMGFTLASLTIILSNSSVEVATKKYYTEREIRGVKINFYRLLVVSFSYLMITETILCLLYYIGSLFRDFYLGEAAFIPNTFFIVFAFNILLATIRTTAMLYFIIVGWRNRPNSRSKNDRIV